MEDNTQKYGLTEAAFTALYEPQNGLCAICGISELELEAKFSAPDDWPADRVLHVDHDHARDYTAVRGLLCRDCNFDLEAFMRTRPLLIRAIAAARCRAFQQIS